MSIFDRKANGDYFVKIIETLAEIKNDSTHLKTDVGDLKVDFKEHTKAGYEQRKIDREKDRVIAEELLKAKAECSRGNQIDNIQKDVNDFKDDKAEQKGWALGRKSIWVIIISVAGLAGGVLGILWRLKLL